MQCSCQCQSMLNICELRHVSVTAGQRATPIKFDGFNFACWQSGPGVSNSVTNRRKVTLWLVSIWNKQALIFFCNLPLRTHDPTQPTTQPKQLGTKLDTMKTSYGTIMCTQTPKWITHQQQLAQHWNPMPHSWTKLSFSQSRIEYRVIKYAMQLPMSVDVKHLRTQARLSHSNPQQISSMDSTLPADRRDLVSVIVWPIDEKSRSDSAELAEMQNTRRATCDKTGKYFWFCLQKTSGLSQAPGPCIALYWASSSRSENTTAPVVWWSANCRTILFLPLSFVAVNSHGSMLE